MTSSVFSATIHLAFAGVAHLVERDLAKVEVASSSLVARSKKKHHPSGWCFLFGMPRAGLNLLPRPARSALNQEVRQGSCEWLCHSWDAGSESRHVMRTSPPERWSTLLRWKLPRSPKPVGWMVTTASLPTSMARYWRERIVNTASSLLPGIGTMIAQTWLSDGEIPVRLKSGIEKSRVFRRNPFLASFDYFIFRQRCVILQR